MVKVLLDTDIGCDEDDMQALGYLLARQDVELLGITTVCGEAVIRAQIADLMCRLAGKTIPIHAGASTTLKGGRMSQPIPEERELPMYFDHNPDIPENTAVEFLRHTIETHPGEITLMIIGASTNIATLFCQYPHVIPLIRRTVIMAGRFGNADPYWGEQECNIRADREAAEIVFHAPLSDVWVFGVEMTCKVFRSDISVVAENAEKCPWMVPFARVIRCEKDAWYHDVVAVVSQFWNEGMEFEQGTVRVNEIGDTIFTADPRGNVKLLRDLDIPAFFHHFCQTLNIPDFPS